MKRTLKLTHLKKGDKAIANLNAQEEKRQLETLDLIASENLVSPAVREALSTVLTNKYAEGYPDARYYPGNQYVDDVELLAQERALKLFELSPNDWVVNVQPYSGSPANFAVYAAVLSEGDTALGMALADGGHLTHGHRVSHSGKFFHFEQYGLDENGFIDYEQVEKLAQKFKPKLIVCGATAYSQIVDFARFGEIAKRHDALLMADVAHIAGLITSGVHPSPFPHTDIVTTTTHKTLRGPRGALIFSQKKAKLVESINRSIFPGSQGGPHNNTTAAIAVALLEASSKHFKKYSKQIVANAQTLAEALQAHGYTIVSGGTQNHLMLIDLQSMGLTGVEAQERLERVGITANKNAVPNDPRKPWDPSGIRLGTPSLTTRGMKEKEMTSVAEMIDEALRITTQREQRELKKRVKELALRFPPPGFDA